MAFAKVKVCERSDTVFKLPPLNDLSDTIFDKALIECLNLRKIGGSSWLGKLPRKKHIQIYELLQEGKTLGVISAFVANQKWNQYKKTPKQIRVIIGRFGSRMETYFNDYGKNQSLVAINEDIPHSPEEYKLPLTFENYPREEGRAMASMLRNAAKMEQRINMMMNAELRIRVSNVDLTKAMIRYHEMQSNIVTLLRQSAWDGHIPNLTDAKFDASNYNPLFGNKDRVDRMIRATDKFLDLIEGKTIPLLKDKNGKFKKVEGSNGR